MVRLPGVRVHDADHLEVFFPTDPSVPGSELNAILMTTAIFGVGFFMRPVGGIILGLYGDKKGRKAAMVMVTSLMAVSIALITVAPTYHAAGILAPIFILIARLLQGSRPAANSARPPPC